MFLRTKMLMGPNDGDGDGGDPEGVSDLETDKKGPTLEELNARLSSIEAENKTLKEERGQLLSTLASVEKLVPARKQHKEDTEPEDDDDVDPAVQKRLERATRKMEQQFASFQGGVLDRLDYNQFIQTAAGMGMTEEEFASQEKEYLVARDSGMSVTDNSGKRRPVTRQDLLDLKLGREMRMQRMKEAPTKQFEALRERLGANAGLESPGGASRAVKGLDLEALQKEADVSKRVSTLEKSLEKVEI